MKSRKAVRLRGIRIELVKHGTERPIEFAKILSRWLLNVNNIPKYSEMAYISSIHKKHCNKACNDYRGITVTSSIGKLMAEAYYTRILENIYKNSVNAVSIDDYVANDWEDIE